MLSTLNDPSSIKTPTSSNSHHQKIDYFSGPNQSKANLVNTHQYLNGHTPHPSQSQDPNNQSPTIPSPERSEFLVNQNSEDFYYNSGNSFIHAPHNAFEFNYIQQIPKFPGLIRNKDPTNDDQNVRPFGPKYLPKPQPEPRQDITKVSSGLTSDLFGGSTNVFSNFSQLGSEKPEISGPDHFYVRKNADINDTEEEEEGENDDKDDKDDEDEEISHLPFNLKRANITQLFSYEEDMEDNLSKDEPKSRISLIESTFRSNAYYHDFDRDFNEESGVPDEAGPPHLQDEEEEQQQIQTNRQRLNSKVFKSSDHLGKDISHYKILLNQLKTSKEKFIDEEFPPDIRSLAGNNKVRAEKWKDCIWLRPGEFYRGGYEIFKGIIEPNDIKQGHLGDCYFLSTLSSLAEWPNRIMKIFETIQVNPSGCYCVKICDMGEWKEVIIDDFFPCDPVTRKPIFTTGNENELWVLILEKVWAKIYGSYDAIERGLTRECLRDFTGAPTKFFLTDRKEEWGMIWRKLLKAKSKKYAMTCGARSFFSRDNVSSKGIVGLHAYSLLGAYNVKIKHRWMKVKLVKLRNPWGKTEWKGDWSDSSSKWTPHLRRKLKVQDKEDGIFFMAYEDFLRYFISIQFCYIHDNYHYNSLKVSSDTNHAVYFKVTVKTEGKYYFTVNQESKRHNQSKHFKYSTVSMVISQIQSKGRFEYCSGNYRADREVWTKSYLSPGEYLVYAKVQWASSEKSKEFVLSTYGPGKATIEAVSKHNYPRFLEKSFMTKARFEDNKMNYAREGESRCFSVVAMSKDGFLYCYYHNDSVRIMDIEVLFKEFKGIKLRKPFRGNSFKISILPGKKQVILLRILPGQDVKQVMSEKVKFRPVNTLSPETYGDSHGKQNKIFSRK